MESTEQREKRLRAHLPWLDDKGIGLSAREAVRKLHTGLGGECKKDNSSIPKLLDEIASDTGKPLDKLHRRR